MKKSITVVSYRFIVLALFFSAFTSIQAQDNFNFVSSSDSLARALKDRFGNHYEFDQWRIPYGEEGGEGEPVPSAAPQLPVQTTPPPCVSGLFEIYFAPDSPSYGFSVAAHRNVVCQVFKDLSELLHDVNPTNQGRVKIWVASDSSSQLFFPGIMTGNIAMSSAMHAYPQGTNNTLLDNEVAKTIKSGINSYTSLPHTLKSGRAGGFFHGFLLINFSSASWYTDFTNNTLTNAQLDLYSNVLREAMHLLGLTTFFNANGQSNKSNNVYSLMDQYLKIGSTNPPSPTISYNTTTNQWNYSGFVGNLATGCGNMNSIFFRGNNLLIQEMSSDAPWVNGQNLNFMSCSTMPGCIGYGLSNGNTFVSAPCLGFGVDHMKRRPNQQEVYALCDLHYKLDTVYGDNSSNTHIYQTYSTCISDTCFAIGFSEAYQTNMNTTLTMNISDIISNDSFATTIDFNDIKVFPTSMGTVASTGTQMTFTPANGVIGDAYIGYYPKCDSNSINGTLTFIYVNIAPPAMDSCDSSMCNLVCHGGFEGSNFSKSWSNLRIDNHNQNSCDLYYEDASGNKFLKHPLTGANIPHNQSFSPVEGEQCIGMVSSKVEALTLSLNSPMKANQDYELSFYAQGDGKFIVYGDSVPVCNPAQGFNYTNGTAGACGFVANNLATTTSLSTTTWTKYTFLITPTQNISHLLFTADNPSNSGGGFAYLDDVVIQPVFDVSATPILNATGNNKYPFVFICDTSTLILGVVTPVDTVYTYEWRLGSTVLSNDTFYRAEKNGEYILEVTKEGCTKSDTTHPIYASSTIEITMATTDPPLCTTNGGSIDVTVSGGNPPYSYYWFDSNSATSEDRTNLDTGIYTIQVTDVNNCMSYKTDTVHMIANTILLNDSVINSPCGNKILLNPTGGNAPYTYAWNDGSTLKDRIGLAVGTYHVTVAEASGCSTTDTFAITATPLIPTLTLTPTYTSCNTVNVSSTITNGQSPYIYQWSNGATTSSVTNVNYKTTPVLYLTVTDANACVVSDTINIFSTAFDPVLTLTPTYTSCSTVDVSSAVTNAQPTYTYQWSTGATTSTVTNVSIVSNPTLYLTLTDANGCSAIDTLEAGGISVGTGTPYPTSSSAQGSGKPFGASSAVNYSKRINVKGTFTIDQELKLNNCEIVSDAGAKIVVNGSTKLSLVSCDLKTCVNTLWKGIEVQGMGAIYIDSSTIEDAQYGVEIVDDGAYRIQNSTFRDNYVGIHFVPYNTNTVFRSNTAHHFTKLENNDFQGSGTGFIKPAFVGMTTNAMYSLQYPSLTFANKSWAGIIATSAEHISISQNTFNNMTNGIIFYNVTTASTSLNFFTNMLKIANPALNNYPNGIGVYSNADITDGPLLPWLIVIGNGKNNATPNFNNCDIGVYSRNSGPEHISDNKMTNVRVGYEGELVNGPWIKNNNITATYRGIYMVNNLRNGVIVFSNRVGGGVLPPDPAFRITDNTVTVTGTSLLSSGIEIQRISGQMNQGHINHITDNDVTTNGTIGYGIYVNNVKAATRFIPQDFADNEVTLNAPATSLGGINYTNCNFLEEKANIVSSNSRTTQNTSQTPAGLFPVGIYYNFTEGIFTCNEISDIRTGARFTGTCNASVFEKNKFNNHTIGMKIDNTVTLADQLNQGNTWAGSFGGGWGAQSNQALASLTNFEVGLTAAAKYWPTPANPPINFFFERKGSGDNDNCTLPPPPIAPMVNWGYLSQLVAQGTVTFDEYEAALVYQNEAMLYEILDPIASTLPDTSAEKLFFDAVDTTAMADFVHIQQDEEELYDLTMAQEVQIEAWNTAIENNYTLLNTLDSAYQVETDDSIRGVLELQIQQTQTNMEQVQTAFEVFMNAQQTENQEEIDDLIEENELTTPTEITGIMQQQFNEVYYHTFAQGNYNLADSQITVYQDLAGKCPLLNADVVYRSRAVMRLYDDTTFYDDALICDSAGLEYKNAKPRKRVYHRETPVLNCTLAPNPTDKWTAILFSEIPNGEIGIMLTDMEGRVLRNVHTLLNTNFYELDTKTLASGTYLIQVLHNNQVILDSKLEIIK